MSVSGITANHPNKDAAVVVEAAIQSGVECKDFDIFLLDLWKSDESRPDIYQRKGSSAVWMDRLEPALQDRDYQR